MNYVDIWESMTEIDLDVIEAAEKNKNDRWKRKKERLLKMAACIVVALGVGGWYYFSHTSPLVDDPTKEIEFPHTMTSYAVAAAEEKQLEDNNIELISLLESQYTIIEGKVINADEPLMIEIVHLYKIGSVNIQNPICVSLSDYRICSEGEPLFIQGETYCFFLSKTMETDVYTPLWIQNEEVSMRSGAMLSNFLIRQFNFNAALLGKNILFSEQYSLIDALDALFGR